MSHINKYDYLFVVQGYYGKWEDLTMSTRHEEAILDFRSYCENERAPHRLIKRRRKRETCCICGQPIVGYGNNAEPVKHGRCCDHCNTNIVVPTRLEILGGNR